MMRQKAILTANVACGALLLAACTGGGSDGESSLASEAPRLDDAEITVDVQDQQVVLKSFDYTTAPDSTLASAVEKPACKVLVEPAVALQDAKDVPAVQGAIEDPIRGVEVFEGSDNDSALLADSIKTGLERCSKVELKIGDKKVKAVVKRQKDVKVSGADDAVAWQVLPPSGKVSKKNSGVEVTYAAVGKYFFTVRGFVDGSKKDQTISTHDVAEAVAKTLKERDGH